MRPSLRLLLVLLVALLLGVLGPPALAMHERVVRAPGPPTAAPGQVVARPAPVRPIPLAPLAAPGPPGAAAPAAGGVWPLDPIPEVVRGFDPPSSTYGAGHRGVDLAGDVGQPVRSALPGEVVYAGRLAGRGVVVVSHGETRTTYEPVTATVGVGDRVDRGQVVGRLQWSGSHCLPLACLHWGLRRGETYLDPLTLVGGGPRPVRLYPW